MVRERGIGTKPGDISGLVALQARLEMSEYSISGIGAASISPLGALYSEGD
jgi:hypothetical protein